MKSIESTIQSKILNSIRKIIEAEGWGICYRYFIVDENKVTILRVSSMLFFFNWINRTDGPLYCVLISWDNSSGLKTSSDLKV